MPEYPRIEYLNFEHPMMKQMAEDLIEPLRPLLPGWVQHLRVLVHLANEGDTETRLMIRLGQQQYMRADLVIFTPWFDTPPEVQRKDILHEIIHLHGGPMLEYVRKRAIDPLEESNPPLYRHLEGEYRDHVERFTESMAWAMERALKQQETAP